MSPQVGDTVFHEYWPVDIKVLLVTIEDNLAEIEFLKDAYDCKKEERLWVTYEYLKKVESLKKHRLGVR